MTRGSDSFCKWQALAINYLIISISSLIAFIMMENCICVYGVQHTVKNQVPKHRGFFIKLATVIPLIPTMIILYTHPLEFRGSIVQPRGYYCFFVRYLLSGTSGWIFGAILMTLSSGLGVIWRVHQLRRNLKRHVPTTKEGSVNSQTQIKISRHFIYSLVLLMGYFSICFAPGLINPIVEGNETFPDIPRDLLSDHGIHLNRIVKKLTDSDRWSLVVPVSDFTTNYRQRIIQLNQLVRIFHQRFGNVSIELKSVNGRYFYLHDYAINVKSIVRVISDLCLKQRLKDRRLSDREPNEFQFMTLESPKSSAMKSAGFQLYEPLYRTSFWHITFKMGGIEKRDIFVQCDEAFSIFVALQMNYKFHLCFVSIFGMLFYYIFAWNESSKPAKSPNKAHSTQQKCPLEGQQQANAANSEQRHVKSI